MVSLIDSRFIASCVGYVIPAVKRRRLAAELGRTPGRGDYAAPLACKKMRRILGVLTALRWRVLGAMALEHTGHCHELALIKCRTGSKLTVSAECVTPASSDSSPLGCEAVRWSGVLHSSALGTVISAQNQSPVVTIRGVAGAGGRPTSAPANSCAAPCRSDSDNGVPRHPCIMGRGSEGRIGQDHSDSVDPSLSLCVYRCSVRRHLHNLRAGSSAPCSIRRCEP